MTLNWSDERYVRWYTRDTPEWLGLSWQARGIFGLVLRTVDRAGILPLGKRGLQGLAVAVRAEWHEIKPFVDELIEDGCIRVVDNTLLVPNFLEAQEAPASDRARARAHREKRAGIAARRSAEAVRDADVTIRGAGITKRDEPSQKVMRDSRQPESSDPVVTDSHALAGASGGSARLGVEQHGTEAADDGGCEAAAEPVLAALRNQSVLREIATRSAAEVAATRVNQGMPVALVLETIEDLANKAQAAADAGSPWNTETLLGRWRSYLTTAWRGKDRWAAKRRQPEWVVAAEKAPPAYTQDQVADGVVFDE